MIILILDQFKRTRGISARTPGTLFTVNRLQTLMPFRLQSCDFLGEVRERVIETKVVQIEELYRRGRKGLGRKAKRICSEDVHQDSTRLLAVCFSLEFQ